MCKTIQMHGFPSNVSAEEVRMFLEQHTGVQTVQAIEIEQQKDGDPWTPVNVQFTDKKSVETILDLVSRHLSYTVYDLNATEIKADILPKPRIFAYSIEGIGVHFGCQTSKEKICVLWQNPNASVKFGPRLRKMYIYFHYLSKDYKLQISSETISRIELHHPHGLDKKLLLFQLRGSPRIYEKDVSESKYFKEACDNHWFRGIDFTPSGCIGQSSALCFELPQSTELPNFRHHYRNYYEFDNNFSLETHIGFSSSNMNFVPMVIPPAGFNLPYKILFKINSLVQHGCLPLPTIDTNLFHMVDPQRIKIEYIESALNKLYQMKECCYEPVQWLEEQYQRYSTNSSLPLSSAISLGDGLVYVHRVQVTPSKIYFCGPEVNLSNRVLRNYPQDIDNFLRVSFVDEDMDKLHSADLMSRLPSVDVDRETKLHQRILSTLKNGIVIGGKKFEFLAFSSSQLRDNSVWMFASRTGLTAYDIRKWMGDFHEIRNVAKYAARLGQSFSSSRETVRVGRHEIEMIPDIELRRGEIKYCFSDGIGKISAELAQEVAKKCGLRDHIPSAFQIRYGGYKGVVAIDPTSSTKLSLRKSMCKYKSQNTKLDVLAWSKNKSCYLNRQVIVLLSTLGVKDHIFKRKQREIVNKLKMISRKPFSALDMMSPGGEITNMLREMLICGFQSTKEPFLSMMLQTLCAAKLQELQLKTRIFVRKGRALLGCLDETRTLNYGEVFVQISLPRNKQSNAMSFLSSKRNGAKKSKYIVKGKVVVAKNPCLHPGDVRILRAMDVPSLHHMVDCVVFPQNGRRPHPNECSGSDLDGDIYFVCWDPGLIPPRQERPMDHTPSKVMNVDHDVTLQDVVEHFTHYIVKDNLGIIASAHTVFADKDPEKAKSPSCTELAKLHSVAVDFAKSGVPAEIPQHLRVEQYPDFMEKKDRQSYQSNSIIGKLYREVKNIAQQKSLKPFTRKTARKLYDHDMEVVGFDKYTTIACEYKHMYDCKLGNLMDYYGIETEAEIISGNILKMSKSFNDRKDLEGINHAVMSLRKEARSWFNEMISKSKSQGGVDDSYAVASAWYHVTYHPSYWGCYNEGLSREHFLSFPWCVHDSLIKIKKDKAHPKTYGMKLWTILKMFLPILMFCFLYWIILQYHQNEFGLTNTKSNYLS